jgi:preprotein translocase subunit SecA
MFFTFTKDLDMKMDLIKKTLRGISNYISVSPQISIKAANNIHDKSNNNSHDLGENIDKLLDRMVELNETLGSEDAKTYLRSHYQSVQAHHGNIKHYTKEQILNTAKELRGSPDLDIYFVMALMNRANEIVTGYQLRPAQILSTLEFFREEGSKFCQFNTGEGKTTITSAIAVIKALQGETVDIITSNEVLAQDAISARSDFYSLFNLSSAHNNQDHQYSKGGKDCYAHDIVYGTIGNFESDYLRHQVESLNTKGDRKFGSLIIDEVDNVVLDNAAGSVKLSAPIAGMDALRYVYINIWQAFIAAERSLGLQDIEPSRITAMNKIAIKSTINKANIKNHSIVPKFLESYVDRKLDTWIDNAMNARYERHENQHYKIAKKDIEQNNNNAEKSVIPLDIAVGVTLQNTVWTDLHPFIQIKHNLQIRSDSLTSIFIANSEYIQLYKNNVFGLTGTLGSKKEQEVMKELYGANSTIMPPHKEGEMHREQNQLVSNDQWLRAIADDAIEHSLKQARATLIICKTIQDVKDLKKQLEGNKNIKIITYEDESGAHEIEKINKEGGIKSGTIVIATNIGGRGTDITLSKEVKENGGLHECTTFIESSRVLKQALGRAGRQGEKGSSKIIIKHQDVEALHINLGNNFNNEEIYDLVDKINNHKIDTLKSRINKAKDEGKYFEEFAQLYVKGIQLKRELKLDRYVLEDFKLQWALAFDAKKEAKDAEIRDVFTRFRLALENIDSYDHHKFINPYFAVKYVESILASGSKNDAEETKSYNIAESILKQSCSDDPSLIYASNMKLFEITISKAQKDKLRSLAKGVTDNSDLTKVQEYKKQAEQYLEEAKKALVKRLEYLENMISSKNFHNIVLPTEPLDKTQENYMLKHIESKYAVLQLQLQHTYILIGLIKNSGNDFVYISAQNSLNELLNKIAHQDITKKLSREELNQIETLGENCFSNLKTIPSITINDHKVKAAMQYIAAGFAKSSLNSPTFTRIAAHTYDTIGNGVLDIMKVIFSQQNSRSESEEDLYNSISFDSVKMIECLKILRAISEYASQDITKIIDNHKIPAELKTRGIKKLKIFEETIAKITPKGLLKSPVGLKGSDATKEQNIDGWIDSYFGEYTLGAIKDILKLRIKDAGIDNVKITNNDYFFVDSDSNNIQDLVGELKNFKNSAIVLIPLNLYNNHATGIVCVINRQDNTNTIKVHYIDPENNKMPTKLEQIFNCNDIETKQIAVGMQEYANCGPEVIENFMLYLTGERLSQDKAIPYHSLLVEQDLMGYKVSVIGDLAVIDHLVVDEMSS